MNNNNVNNDQEIIKRRLLGDSKAQLLALRKQQAEELAALKDDNFTIVDGLDELKQTLLVDDINNSEETTQEEQSIEYPTAKEDNQEAELQENKDQEEAKEKAEHKDKEDQEKKKVAPKDAKESKEEIEEKAAKEEKKEPKEAKAEEAKAEKSTPKKKTTTRKTTPKSKTTTTKKTSTTKTKSSAEKDANIRGEEESVKTEKHKDMEKKDTTKKIDNPKSFFETKLKTNISKLDDVNSKGIIDNLQKLREQIMIQKRLEREMMETEAEMLQKKELEIKKKLSDLELLVKEDDFDADDSYAYELEEEVRRLTNELEDAKTKLNNLLSITYNNIPVFDSQTLALSESFLKAFTDSNDEEINQELLKIQQEFLELRQDQEKNRQSLIIAHNQEKIRLLNDLKTVELKLKDLERENEKLKDKLDSRETANIKEITAKHQAEIDSLISQHREEISRIQEEYEIKLKEQGTNKGLVEEYLNKLKAEREKHNQEVLQLQRELEKAKYLNIAQKQLIKDNEDRYHKQLEELKAQIEAQQKEYQEYKENVANEKNQKIILLQEEVKKQKEIIKNYKDRIDAEAKEKITKLLNEFSEEKKKILAESKQKEEHLLEELENMQTKVSGLESLLEEYKFELEKLLQRVKTYKEQLAEERTSHYEIEQKLFNDLDSKEQEIMRLKQRLEKVQAEEKDINRLASLFSHLGVKDYYPPYYSYEQLKNFYEQEIARRDQIISSLNKNVPPKVEEDHEFEEKISKLELQIEDLNKYIKSINQEKPEKEETTDIFKGITLELEKFKEEIRQELNRYREKTQEQKTISEVEKELDIPLPKEETITPIKTSASEEQVEIDFSEKISSSEPEDIIEHQETTDSKQEEREDFEKAPESELSEDTIASPEKSERIAVDFQEITPAFEPLEEEKVKSKEVSDRVHVTIPEEKEQIEINLRTPPQEAMPEASFVGKIDQEYLHKLNNIRKLQMALQEKKNELSENYKVELQKNQELQQECQEKIDEVQNRIEELNDLSYQEDNGIEDKDHFEKEKTRLYFELQAREEKLRKIQEDDLRKINLRYRNEIENIDHQLETLRTEEQDLKESYILRQQKLESKQKRENEILSKLEQEKRNLDYGRVIESQEEKKQKKFRELVEKEKLESGVEAEIKTEIKADLDVEAEKVSIEPEARALPEEKIAFQEEREEIATAEEEQGDVETFQEVQVESKQEEPQTQESIQQSLELDVEKKDEEQSARLRTKEQELKQLFERYSLAEKKLCEDFVDVRTFKAIKIEKLAYDKEYEKKLQHLQECKAQLEKTTDSYERSKLEDEIKSTNLRLTNLKTRIAYLSRQMESLDKNKNVVQYIKVTDKLDKMKEILIKYANLREKASEG